MQFKICIALFFQGNVGDSNWNSLKIGFKQILFEKPDSE
jgi:hypothetical protein